MLSRSQKQIIHPFHIGLSTGPVFFLVFLCLLLVPPAYSRSSPQVVAKVNGMPIYRSDISCALEAFLVRQGPAQKELSQDGKPPAPDNDRALRRLIDIELLYQEGLKQSFPGLDEEVERRYRMELARIGGKERLSAALSCINMDIRDLKKNIFRNLVINHYLDKAVYSRIHVSPAAIEPFYSANLEMYRVARAAHVNQIFIRVKTWKDKSEVHSALSRARLIHNEAEKGSDFASLARKYSQDPAAGATAGDMGLIQEGNLHNSIEKIIFSLPEGGISPPVETRGGFRIFKVVSYRPSAYRPLNEVRDEIVAKLRRKKARAMISELVEVLRSKAKIEIMGK